MSQITRCPACATQFKVVPDQLRISEGWVRCGQCKQVFDAVAHMVVLPPAELLPSLPLGPSPTPPAAAPTPAVATPRPAVPDARLPDTMAPSPDPGTPGAAAAPGRPGTGLVRGPAKPPAWSLSSASRDPWDKARTAPAVPATAPPAPALQARAPVLTARPPVQAAVVPSEPAREGVAEAARSQNAGTTLPTPPPSPAAPIPATPQTPTASPATAAPAEGGAPTPRSPAGGAGDVRENARPSARATPPNDAAEPSIPAAERGTAPPAVTPAGAAPALAAAPLQPAAAGPGDDALALPPIGFPDDLPPSPTPVAPAAQHGVPPLPELPLPPQGDAPEPAPAPAAPAAALPPAEPAAGVEEDAPAVDDVGFVRAARRQAFWRKPLVRAALLLCGLAAAAALLLQVALHERDRWAAWYPPLRPWLQALCEPLACRIAPWRDLDAVVIDSSSFTKGRGDGYQLLVTVKNRSAHPVAMPAVELTLTDAQDQPVLRKVLSPQDLAAPAELAAQAEWNAALGVVVTTGGARVAGYRLLVFYP